MVTREGAERRGRMRGTSIQSWTGRASLKRLPGWIWRGALATVLVAFLLPDAAIANDPDALSGGYVAGRGWTVPDTSLTFGGYASAAVTQLKAEPWSFDFRHLSLLTWWQGDSPIGFFSEVELQNSLQAGRRPSANQDVDLDVATQPYYVDVERLYLDWTISDALKFRLGKFLTPIGRWNLIHADPLVWTTSRPLVTEVAFPTNATGAMAYGTIAGIGHGLDYSIYGSSGQELQPDTDVDTFTKAYGMHLSYPFSPSIQLGGSFANFEQRNEPGERKNIGGLDFVWSKNRYEVSAEAVYRFSSQGSRQDEKGAYLQGVAPLTQKLYGIVRFEYFEPPGAVPGTSLWLGGIAYKFNRTLMLKAEYSGAVNNRINEPEGFQASIAVLF
jgi:hypothetical protein